MCNESSSLLDTTALLARRLRHERDSELTPSQLAILDLLGSDGQLTPTEIAQHEGVQPPTVSRTVDCLARINLVTKHDDHKDGRQVLVQLSPEGQAMLNNERTQSNLWLADKLADLDDADYTLLLRARDLLERLARS